MTVPNPDAWAFTLAGVTFGADTAYVLQDLELDKPEIRTTDAPLPGADGVRMGRDFLSGSPLSFTLGIKQPGDPAGALALLEDLRRAWQGDPARTTPGAVVALSYTRPGDVSRRIYGRPRKFTPTLTQVTIGWIPVVAEFQAADGLFYAETQQSLTLTLPETDDEAIVPPFTPPATPLPYVDVQRDVTNGGNAATWPVVTFTGPVTNPTFWFPDSGVELAVLTDVGSGESVTVDTRPWARTIAKGDGTLLAGAGRGAALVDLALPTGTTTVAFSGHDLSATGQMTVAFRDAWTSL